MEMADVGSCTLDECKTLKQPRSALMSIWIRISVFVSNHYIGFNAEIIQARTFSCVTVRGFMYPSQAICGNQA